MTVQVLLIPDLPYAHGEHAFLVAFSTSLVVSYWLLAGLIAMGRPWPARVRFRLWLASRHTHTLPAMIGCALLTAVMPYSDGTPAMLLAGGTWSALYFWMIRQDLPPVAPGRLSFRQMDYGLLPLRLLCVAAFFYSLDLLMFQPLVH